MKWGVRKEKERSGKFVPKNASKEDIAVHENKKRIKARDGGQYKNHSILPATGENKWIESNDEMYKMDKRLGEAHSTFVWLKSMASQQENYPYFQDFMRDVSSGSSKHDSALDTVLKKYNESSGKNFDMEKAYSRLSYLTSKAYSFNGELSDEEWAELTELTEYGTALMEYYKQYEQIRLDEKMENENKRQEELVKNLKKAISDRGIILRENQNVKVEEENGNLFYKYTTRNGKELRMTNLDLVLDAVEKDSEALKDFRNRKSSTRTREKNVDSNVKPVSIKKGEKIKTGEKERQSKAQRSPAAAKTKQKLYEMSKIKDKYGSDAIKRNKLISKANADRRTALMNKNEGRRFVENTFGQSTRRK